MADSKGNAYGSTTSDTSFRKTWDRTEYAEKAKQRAEREREEGKARYEAKVAGKKYIPRAKTPPEGQKESASRQTRLNVAAHVGKTSLVPAGAAVGKRGRGAGFYCADCDLTFKDNLQFVDHLNSKQHLMNVGESGEVKRAGVEDVRERLAWLKRKMEEEMKEADRVDLDRRLEQREEDDERKREEKRRKRREKRRRTEGGVGHNEDVDQERGGIIC
jgi:U4/U6.U5 tri-snRNP component SNU23